MRRVVSLLLMLGLFLFLCQCSGGKAPAGVKRPDRTLQDVDRDLQKFKSVIRAEVKSRNSVILLAGGFSLLLNLILAGFVLYYRKKSALLAPQPKKTAAKKAAPRKKAEAGTQS